MKKCEVQISIKLFLVVLVAIILTINSFHFVKADPEGPDIVNIISNSTKSSVSSKMINFSGGYIASINLSATIKDTRWKAFVGNVYGMFTLDDGSGASIYDWALTSLSGRIYTTRNSTSVLWSNINCTNVTTLNQENSNLQHTNPNDNLTVTFTVTGGTHGSFYVGSRFFPANYCPTLNTYVSNSSQDSYFEEMALYDGNNVVYASVLDNNRPGYNGANYDFQMMVPENGNPGFTGATAYYLYVEIGS